MYTPPIEPLVSVIMGVRYRREDLSLLERSVQSILDQTLGNFEFLICEWDSTEEAKARIERFAAEDKRIRMIEGNGADTLAAKLNRCLKQAKGQYIARMDDDDYSAPERFEKQIRFLQQKTGCAFVGSWVRECDGDTEAVRHLPEWPTLEDFRITLPFVHPALMFQKSRIQQAGGYSENVFQIGCDDYDLLFRMYVQGCCGANIPEVLLNYSVENSQLNRKPYHVFFHEFCTRISCYKMAGLLPMWWIWAVKPLFVGIVPRRLLYRIKHSRRGRGEKNLD